VSVEIAVIADIARDRKAKPYGEGAKASRKANLRFCSKTAEILVVAVTRVIADIAVIGKSHTEA